MKSLCGVLPVLLVLVSLLVPSAMTAQDPPTTQPATGGSVRLQADLFDASLYIVQSHGGQKATDKVPLAGAEVVVQELEDGSSAAERATTDAEGRIDIDLGVRPAGSFLLLKARTEKGIYFSIPLPATSNALTSIPMFRGAQSESTLDQQVMRVVTQNENQVTGQKSIHVRQILFVRNNSFDVFVGKPEPGSDRYGPTFIFPVPEGAEMQSLTVNRQEIFDLTPRLDPTWGVYGVPIQNALYPTRDASVMQLMGTFTLRVPVGEVVDLGLPGTLATHGFQLALENRRFDLESTEGGVELTANGPTEAPGVSVIVNGWSVEKVPAGQSIVARVRFGDPGIDGFTWFMTFVWVGGAGLAVLLGLFLAKRKGGGHDVLTTLAELDVRLARGEIDVRTYQSEQARLRESLPDMAADLAPSFDTVTAPETVAPDPEPAAVRATGVPDDVMGTLGSLFADGNRASETEITERMARLDREIRRHLLDDRA